MRTSWFSLQEQMQSLHWDSSSNAAYTFMTRSQGLGEFRFPPPAPWPSLSQEGSRRRSLLKTWWCWPSGVLWALGKFRGGYGRARVSTVRREINTSVFCSCCICHPTGAENVLSSAEWEQGHPDQDGDDQRHNAATSWLLHHPWRHFILYHSRR